MKARLSIRIDLSQSTPAYEQIAGALRSHLVSRELEPGDVLPSVRQLATDLAVHFNTVAQAYRILAAEGWLNLRRRRGASVLARPAETASAAVRDAVSVELSHLVASAVTQGVPAKELRLQFERLLRKYSPQSP